MRRLNASLNKSVNFDLIVCAIHTQETLKSSLEASVIPAFEMSCKAMFEQVDATFQKGMIDHAIAAQQQFESTHSPLALALRVYILPNVCSVTILPYLTYVRISSVH